MYFWGIFDIIHDNFVKEVHKTGRIDPDVLFFQLTMDANLHVNALTDEASLLDMLTETIRELKAVSGAVGGWRCIPEVPGRGGGEEMLSPAEDEDRGRHADGELECKQRVLGVLRELSVAHSDRVTAWRGVLRECSDMICKCPPGGSDQQHQSTTDSFSDTFLSVGEDIKNIMDTLNAIITKLDAEILKLRAEEASTVDAQLQETQATEKPDDDNDHQDPIESDSGYKLEVEDQSHTMPSPDTENTPESRFSSSDRNNVEETGKELVVKGQGSDNEDCVSPESQTDFLEETEKDRNRVNVKEKEETNNKWITVG